MVLAVAAAMFAVAACGNCCNKNAEEADATEVVADSTACACCDSTCTECCKDSTCCKGNCQNCQKGENCQK